MVGKVAGVLFGILIAGWTAVSVNLRSTIVVPPVAAPIVAQQDPSGHFPNEPPEYADGVMCSPKGDIFKGLQTPDHPCSCKNMWRDSHPNDEGCCDERVTNDSTCKQWCHEQHCACPHICVPGKADETATPDNNDGADPQ